MGVKLHVWGERACFTRPELKVERVSYDVPTPTAARGILEAIHWKPAIRWHVDRIHVLRPIRFQSFRRNEVGAKASASLARSAMNRGTTEGLGLTVDENRQQRATMLLVDVAYLIEAHFKMTDRAGPDDTPAKHISMFNRRAEQGQAFHRPCLGTREFDAHFALAEADPVRFEELTPAEQTLYRRFGPVMLPTRPVSELPDDQRGRDLGWMLFDIDHGAPGGAVSRFYRARIDADGVVDCRPSPDELAA